MATKMITHIHIDVEYLHCGHEFSTFMARSFDTSEDEPIKCPECSGMLDVSVELDYQGTVKKADNV
jgi:DNA-directed RNA polymerase subunit RPC12/RpoP